jgi:putative addiction module component (TIGR02574 family)
MATTLKQLTHEALELPVQERAKLAYVLSTSINEKTDGDMSSAWDAELKKRVREIRDGRVKGIPAEEVFAKLEEKYR